MLSTYRRALTVPGALRFSASGTLARMPISMIGLGVVILVSERTGSYGLAGTVSAAYVVANALGGIPLARLVDRRGQSRVLLPAVVVSVAALVLLVVAVEAGRTTPWAHAAAALAGVSMPNIGAAVRARWTHAVRERRVLDTAFAWEAVNDEVVFVVGPTVTALLSAAWHPWAGLAVAGAFALVGTTLLVAARSTEPPAGRVAVDAGGEPVLRSAMPWRGVLPLALGAMSLGGLFGGVEVATVAFADERDAPGMAGVVLAVWAAGSLLSGLVTGALTFRRSPAVRFRLGSAALATLLLPLPFLGSFPALTVVLFFCGTAISPTLIASVAWVESMVPADRLNEGMAAVTTGLVAGVAPGAAVTGVVVDSHGASASYLVAIVVAFTGVLVGWVAQRVSPRNRVVAEVR